MDHVTDRMSLIRGLYPIEEIIIKTIINSQLERSEHFYVQILILSTLNRSTTLIDPQGSDMLRTDRPFLVLSDFAETGSEGNCSFILLKMSILCPKGKLHTLPCR